MGMDASRCCFRHVSSPSFTKSSLLLENVSDGLACGRSISMTEEWSSLLTRTIRALLLSSLMHGIFMFRMNKRYGRATKSNSVLTRDQTTGVLQTQTNDVEAVVPDRRLTEPPSYTESLRRRWHFQSPFGHENGTPAPNEPVSSFRGLNFGSRATSNSYNGSHRSWPLRGMFSSFRGNPQVREPTPAQDGRNTAMGLARAQPLSAQDFSELSLNLQGTDAAEQDPGLQRTWPLKDNNEQRRQAESTRMARDTGHRIQSSVASAA